MANEAVLKFGMPKALEANGGSIANNALAQASDAPYAVIGDGANYPHAKFVLSATFGTAPTEGTILVLYARPLNIKSTNDAEAPETTRPTVYIGSFVVNNVTTAQYIELLANNVPWEAEYYLHNNGTGQTVSAGWTLDAIPFTVGPA